MEKVRKARPQWSRAEGASKSRGRRMLLLFEVLRSSDLLPFVCSSKNKDVAFKVTDDKSLTHAESPSSGERRQLSLFFLLLIPSKGSCQKQI